MRNGEAMQKAAAEQEPFCVRLRLADAEEIRRWSKGDVTDPEPFDGRSQRPREKGLFSEKIFGEEKDAFGRPVEVRECMCGQGKDQGAICTKCGTPVTYGRVRRKRFGHIELATPVVHTWFLKSRPSPLALLLDLKAASLEKVVYFQEYIVLDPGQTPLTKGQLLNQQAYEDAQRTHGENAFQAGMGAEAIQTLLQGLDLNQLSRRLSEELKNYDGRQASYERKTGKLLRAIAQAETACTEAGLIRLHRAKLKQLGSEHRRADREDGARIRRLQLVRNLLAAGDDGSNKPEGMVLKCLPVIPPDLRPCHRSHARRPRPNPGSRAVGRTAKERLLLDDLNLLYQNVLRRNERLRALQDKKEDVPAQILCNEKRLLQEAVDALLDNRRARPQFFDRSGKLPLKSLTDRVDGKYGVFRRYLLGKMVDYVGRSVIVPGPKLRLHQCGLPKPIARTLFQPFLIRRTAEEVRKNTGLSLDLSVRLARMIVLDQDDRAERILLTRLRNQGSALPWLGHKEKWLGERLAEMLPTHPVLLSRAPTLHRLNLQAFQPVLVEGKAIQLHPLVCAGFGADFDGDAMTVHLPLSREAQAEAWEQLLVTHNLFSPGDGAPILSPSQEMVMGCYYLTMAISTPGESAAQGQEKIFSSPTEVLLAHAENKISIHARIVVRLPVVRTVINEGPNERTLRRLSTTVGRVLFNDILPCRMPFYDLTLTDKHLGRIISDCFRLAGREATVAFLDRLKALGLREATRSGLSISVDDLTPPPNKPEVLQAAGRENAKIQQQYAAGKITEEERYNKILAVWQEARTKIKRMLLKTLAEKRGRLESHRPTAGAGESDRTVLNPVHIMVASGARDNKEQITQLAGMRGLLAGRSGRILETPIQANFRDGLKLWEYFHSVHGGRKTMADKKLLTGGWGYLTRRLIHAAESVVITEKDCGTTEGVIKKPLDKDGEVDRPLSDAIRGRVSLEDVMAPDGKPLIKANELITEELARRLEKNGRNEIKVRSPVTCQAARGVCQLCYGLDLARGRLVELGTAVGVLAGQSIGERGTQKMMKGKHTGGTAELPTWAREIQAKKPGTIRFQNLAHLETRDGQRVVLAQAGKLLLVGLQGKIDERHPVPYGAHLLVNEGDPVQPGTRLCQWDPYMVPILAEAAGRVRFNDLVEGETLIREVEGKQERWIVSESRRGLHPQIVLESEAGQILASYPLPARAHLEVRQGQVVEAGDRLVRVPRSVGTTQDIAGALPQLTRIFEASPVHDAAILAEIAGKVRLGQRQRRHWSIWVETEEAKPRNVYEHRVPHGRRLRVKTGDTIRAGEPLTDGPVALADLLRILGPDVVQSEIVARVQRIYRDQRAWVDDKHIEIIVGQMLGKVMIKTTGDTDLLPGSVMDKSALRAANKSCRETYVKIKEPGDSSFKARSLVRKETFAAERSRLVTAGKQPPTCVPPQPATGRVLLLGIKQVAMLADSFLAAASFQSVPKVLMEAALAGKRDEVTGIKPSIMLGRLVPLGTGLRPAGPIRSTGPVQETASVSRGTPPFARTQEESATAGRDR